jgi:glycerol-1-phosphate dehydrogenase [NAD(P)+]
MNPNELLNRTFECECGRSHSVPVRELIYAEDALERLPDVLGSFVDGRRVVLVADRRTFEIAGRRAWQVLEEAHWSVRQIIVPDTAVGGPVCDEATHEWLNSRLPPVDIALAVGGGVINDLTKWSAFEHKLPYAVAATAATMNGYTAANVAPTLNGVKSLIRAQAPLAVFAVPSIIVEAPFELTTAGLGDVIAKPISTTDWLLNHIFVGEYFCAYCSEMISALEPYYFDRPQDIRDRQPAAIEALFRALLYSGIAMTIIGSSAPASGGEHLFSHTLDMMSGADGVPHDLHGRQVGLGTLFASALYQRICHIEDVPPLNRGRDARDTINSAFWGPLAGAVRQQYEQKIPVLNTLREKLTDGRTWATFISACRRQVRSPEQIKNCLRTAGAAHTFADIGCTRERFLAAVLHAHEIRRRPTVIDLAWILGILPDAAEEIIDRWLTC